MEQGRREPNLLHFWYALYARRWLALLIVGSAMLSALLLSWVLPPVYEARALFFVPAFSDLVTFVAAPSGPLPPQKSLAPAASEDANAPYIGILRGTTLAESVAKEFPGKTVRDLKLKDIDVGLTDEYLLEVYARDRDPKIAAGLANAYVRHFNSVMADYQMQSRGQFAETLRAQLEEHRRVYNEQVAALRAFERDNKIADFKSEKEQLTRQRMDFAAQLEQSKVVQGENARKIESVRAAVRSESQTIANDALSQFLGADTFLSGLKAQMVDLEMKMASLKVDVTASHRDLVALRESYAAAKESVERELARIVKSEIKSPELFYEDLRRQLVNLYVERVQLDARAQALLIVIERVDGRIQAIPEMRLEMDRMQDAIDYHKRVIDQFALNQEEIAAQAKRAPLVGVVVDVASPPPVPAFPIVWLNLLVAFLAGTSVALFYVLFMDYLERTRGERIWSLLRSLDAQGPTR